VPAAIALLAACSGGPPPPAPPPPRAAPIAAAPRAAPQPWRYDVVASAGGRELEVEAVVSPPTGCALGFEDAAGFVSGVEVSTGGAFQPVATSRGADGEPAYHLPPCPPGGCRVRYRMALADAARRVDDIGCATEANGAILTSPSAWLLHPRDPDDGQPFLLHVAAPPGAAFVTGLLPAGGAFPLPPDQYGADVSDLPNPPWAALGDLRLLRVDAGGEAIDVAVLPGALDADDAALRAWVAGAAQALHDYYGMASIRRVLLVLVPKPGRGIGYARTLGNGGATIVAPLGAHTTPAELTGGWELVHEMLHVAFPTLPRDQAWLEEGMATYVEPLIRARRGIITAEEAFGRLHQRMPFGVPGPGDQGLDRTHTWGRTYWGGAMFCLLADATIRERTGNRRSLDDALRAILAAGGNVSKRWDVAEVIAAGDAATGVPVLAELYAKLAAAPGEVDLDALWKRLGVVAKGDDVVFDETAPLAEVRRAMVRR
jgi:hypothetical protein